jgi:hypothetical protein
VYKLPHYAVIDVMLDLSILTNNDNDLSHPHNNNIGYLNISIINHLNQIVRTKIISIYHRHAIVDYIHELAEDDIIINDNEVCIGIWGNDKNYQKLLFKFTFAILILFFIVLPLLFILWLFIASAMYLFYVRGENQRRERIEAAVLAKKNAQKKSD